MHLDSTTLQVMGAIAIAISGALLFFTALVLRESPALRWWAAANFVYAIGIAGVIPVFADRSLDLGRAAATLIDIAPSLMWAGMRRFHGRPISPAVLIAGPAVLVATLFATVGPASESVPMVTGFLCWIAYLAMVIFELWRGRSEALIARWPLIGLFAIHLFIYVGGVVDGLRGSLLAGGAVRIGTWFGIIHFEGTVYAMGTAIFLVLLCKERIELGIRYQANVDGLTGVANRKAFMDRATAMMEQCRKTDTPLSLLLVDVDRFKAVNDGFGHAMGDRVLGDFAGVGRGFVRPSDIIGRLGGDEFALLLPGRSPAAAFAVAEKLRVAFAEASRQIGGFPVNASVSIGVAAATARDTRPEEIIARADEALYEAKRLGRNRSCAARPEPAGNDTGTAIIRVA
jgi:diguanylate cyclase (GGDEF)-like protein